MSGEKHPRYNSEPGTDSRDGDMREAATMLMTSLQSHIDILSRGSPEARRMARELQIVLQQISHALRD